MHSSVLKRWGVLFILFGLLVVGFSIYFSCLFGLTGLTEAVPGLVTIYLGAHLICVANQQDSSEEDDGNDSGRASSPFYYELEEPFLFAHRALPPIPKDIGREYDPVVLDKV